MTPLRAEKLIPGEVKVTTEELDEVDRWVAAKLQGRPECKPAQGFLMPHLKSGRLRKNQAAVMAYGGAYEVANCSLRIAESEFHRGLHCPSEGRIVVHLPAPAVRFEAVVGVDSNQVSGFPSNAGRGSAIASVEVGDQEAFRSPVMQEGMPGVPVEVNLGGATQLTLVLGDAGGGTIYRNNFCQLDWAEACVTLADGGKVWLDQLPIGPLRAPYGTEAPFSFRYDGLPSGELLETWERARGQRELDESRRELTQTYSDPRTGLEVRCVAVQYRDFPVVEWTLEFRNTGDQPTPILEQIRALDTRLEREGDDEFLLHHGKGSPCGPPLSPTEYAPMETRLERSKELCFAARNGMPAGGDLPYFNVEWPDHGVIIAVGWPGQWAATFMRNDGRELHIQAGQELTRLQLLPGERLCAARIAVLFWNGEWIRSQNLWRRWMVVHNLPRPGGKLPPPQLAAGSAAQHIEMSEADEENQLAFIRRYAEVGIQLDYWWCDAGWYPFPEGWWDTGTWQPDPQRFPRGLRPISDALHSQGAGLILWFTPERAAPGTWLYENHPDWLIGVNGESNLVDFGHPDAWRWMVERVDKLIEEQGVDVYRHDGGCYLQYWRANDAQDRRGVKAVHKDTDQPALDRQGVTENHHLAGVLGYWDELRRRHPDMLTDICAGGGSRNALEFLRRAVPLWRSDYAYETTGMQNHTYGMSLWIPYFGTGVNALDPYSFRSQMAPALGAIWDVRRADLDFDFLRKMVNQWRDVADNYYGDYYPLTAYRTEDDVWMAWQFNRPEAGAGMVQAFRRPKSAVESMRFRLHGLDPVACYEVSDMDTSGKTVMMGQDMMADGLLVALGKQPDSALIAYKRTT
ncbi:MAG: alpha-galactosidase [Verrucomicrobia bacterium]|nr:alpha-galactosidase [Verrucomicrobiota bacterium]